MPDNRVEAKPTQKQPKFKGINENTHAAVHLTSTPENLHIDASYNDAMMWLRAQIPSLANYSNAVFSKVDGRTLLGITTMEIAHAILPELKPIERQQVLYHVTNARKQLREQGTGDNRDGKSKGKATYVARNRDGTIKHAYPPGRFAQQSYQEMMADSGHVPFEAAKSSNKAKDHAVYKPGEGFWAYDTANPKLDDRAITSGGFSVLSPRASAINYIPAIGSGATGEPDAQNDVHYMNVDFNRKHYYENILKKFDEMNEAIGTKFGTELKYLFDS